MCRLNEVRDNCTTTPKLIHNVSPQFSEYARKKKITGSVQLKLTVRPDGTTSDIVVTRSLEKSLDAQAIKAVQQWQFEPSTYQGQPVAVSIAAEVNFRLY
jgi:TonB family protein